MEVFGLDARFGDFVLSDHGLMLASFEYDGASNDDLALTHNISEEYINNTAVPLYQGSTYSDKLELQITLVPKTGNFLSEIEVRTILRTLTGMDNYQWFEILEFTPYEKLYYKAKTTKATLQRVLGKTAGIVLTLSCDSPYAWSQEYHYKYSMDNQKNIFIYNTSDVIYERFYPTVVITPHGNDFLKIINETTKDGTIFSSVIPEEIIVMDNLHEKIVSTSYSSPILNRFNFKWISMVDGKNEFAVNSPVDIEFICRYPRKAGVY